MNELCQSVGLLAKMGVVALAGTLWLASLTLQSARIRDALRDPLTGILWMVLGLGGVTLLAVGVWGTIQCQLGRW